ncbi:MAG: hypothetical protein IJ800_02270, partial [Clostridia bacterium]|nr:hypothetical protein [Clostridia bacterium]
KKVKDDIEGLGNDTTYFANVIEALNTVIANSDATVAFVNAQMANTDGYPIEYLEPIENLYKALHESQQDDLRRLYDRSANDFFTNLRTAQLQVSAAELPGKVAELEAAVKGDNEEYDEESIYAQLAAIKEELAALEEKGYDDTNLQNAVKALQDWVDAYKSYDDTEIKEALRSVQEWIIAYRPYDDSEVEDLKERVSDLESQLADFKEAFDELKKQVEEGDSESNSNGAAISNITTCSSNIGVDLIAIFAISVVAFFALFISKKYGKNR